MSDGGKSLRKKVIKLKSRKMETSEFVQISLGRYNQFYELQKAEPENKRTESMLEVITVCLDDGIVLKTVDLHKASVSAGGNRVTGKLFLKMKNRKLELHHDPIEFFKEQSSTSTSASRSQDLNEISQDCYKVTGGAWIEFFCEMLGISRDLIDINPEIV